MISITGLAKPSSAAVCLTEAVYMAGGSAALSGGGCKEDRERNREVTVFRWRFSLADVSCNFYLELQHLIT